MKVAQVTLRFDAPGGVETNVREIARRLAAAGVDVTVFASDLWDESGWQRRSGYPPVVDGVPVRRFPVRKRLVPGLTMPMMVGLIDALSESGADVLHAHSHRYGHILQAAAVSSRRRIPLVVSTHYHPADRREPTIKRGLLRLQDVLFGSTAYRVARALVVETELEARRLREFAPADRLRVIPPGIDLAEWAHPELDRPPPGLPDRYVVFHGRLASNKGLETLVAAVGEIPPGDRLPVVFVGPDWGMQPRLEAAARRAGVDGLLRSVGWQSPAATRGIVRGASALVLPSEWEAFGLVLLMGMAARTPLVATAVGGVPEVLEGGRAGRLVPYGDPAALARALVEVGRDGAATRAMVARAAERVQGYDWSVAADRHRALYRELAGG